MNGDAAGIASGPHGETTSMAVRVRRSITTEWRCSTHGSGLLFARRLFLSVECQSA